jgi:hypothetical protein
MNRGPFLHYIHNIRMGQGSPTAEQDIRGGDKRRGSTILAKEAVYFQRFVPAVADAGHALQITAIGRLDIDFR